MGRGIRLHQIIINDSFTTFKLTLAATTVRVEIHILPELACTVHTVFTLISETCSALFIYESTHHQFIADHQD